MGRKWTDSSVETGTSVAAGDLILTVSDPSGTPVSKKITVQNLMDSDSVREAIRDHLGDVVIQGGANVTVTHDDPSNTITVAVTSLDSAPVGATTPSTGSFTVNTVDQLVFDIAAAIESNTAGEMSWDADAETVMLALNDNIHMHVGQDSLYHAVNQTGSDIAKGTAVYAVGTVGNSGKITIAPFTADGTLDSKYFMGVTAETIVNGETGFVTHFGKIRQIDTTDFEEGDILYADPSVAGGLTNVRPAAPNNIITVAIVVTKHQNVGELFVRPTFIDGFADNEDVTITSAATGDVLRYNGTVWVNYPDSNFASASGLSTHIADTENPHAVTKAQVGLSNVENTALSTWAGSANITTLGTIAGLTVTGDIEAGTTGKLYFDESLGRFGINRSTSPGAAIDVSPFNATTRAFRVIGVTGQSQDLVLITNNLGTAEYLKISGSGAVTMDQTVTINSDLTLSSGDLFVSSGDLRVGTTSAVGSESLTVNGDSNISGDLIVGGTEVTLTNLPTADPVNAGQLWNDSGTVKVSAG
jgi:hypothetical protein